MIDIDGSLGEGGGQMVRTAVAASAVTGKELHITNIRRRRSTPGLAAQHVAAVRCVAQMCSATVEGADVGSQEITFLPGKLKGGDYTVDVGTAGSIPLVLQAGFLAASFAPSDVTLEIKGGTDIRQAPTIDYLNFVFVPILSRMGIRITLDIKKRGYYPQGGGLVSARISPARPPPFRLEGPGRIMSIGGRAHVVRLPDDIMKRMALSAAAELKTYPAKTVITEEKPEGIGEGTGITVFAATEYSFLGACATGERGLRAENIGALAGKELAADLKSGASVDTHLADQLVPYLALGQGGSFTLRQVSSHLETGMGLLHTLTGAVFKSEKKYGLIRIECTVA